MLQTIIDYFSTIPSSHRTLIIISGLVLFSLIETAVPLFSINYSRGKHAMTNIFFTLTTMLVNFILAFLLLSAADWVVTNEFGLLQLIEMPLWLYAILGVLLLDLLSAWLPHWTEHHVTWMWKFHVIHHTDQNIDVTTANRHHPGESVIRFVFTILATIILGTHIWIVFLYQSLSVLFTQFNHSNIVLPNTIDAVFNKIVCTPNMHHIHHHYRQPYSDTNYGNIFSIWDRLFGTYMTLDPEKIVYGVDTFPNEKENSSILGLLKQPFHKYRRPTTDQS